MTTSEIWLQPKEKSLALFIERYLDLDEHTGNRTLQEKDEMLEIATAIMPTLIRSYEREYGDIYDLAIRAERMKPRLLIRRLNESS